MADEFIKLKTGKLTTDQIDLIFQTLPVDVSFVDENDTVVYYSEKKDRIFTRVPGVIGRQVQNCHPAKSVAVVEKILKSFKSGQKDTAEFWIQIEGRFIHIRYFAVRDENGNYRGCLEVSQDVTEIRQLQGQRRLLDWD
ncbi:MAG: PAS domain-containing protein [Candidatus Saccharicenans sp.]